MPWIRQLDDDGIKCELSDPSEGRHGDLFRCDICGLVWRVVPKCNVCGINPDHALATDHQHLVGNKWMRGTILQQLVYGRIRKDRERCK